MSRLQGCGSFTAERQDRKAKVNMYFPQLETGAVLFLCYYEAMMKCCVCSEAAKIYNDLKIKAELCEVHHKILLEAERKNDLYFKIRSLRFAL